MGIGHIFLENIVPCSTKVRPKLGPTCFSRTTLIRGVVRNYKHGLFLLAKQYSCAPCPLPELTHTETDMADILRSCGASLVALERFGQGNEDVTSLA